MSSTNAQNDYAFVTERLPNLAKQELLDLHKEIDRELKRRDAIDKANARKQIAEIAHEHGIELDYLARKKVKYRDPDNPFNSWSGKGRKPKWFTLAIAKGYTEEDLKEKR